MSSGGVIWGHASHAEECGFHPASRRETGEDFQQDGNIRFALGEAVLANLFCVDKWERLELETGRCAGR